MVKHRSLADILRQRLAAGTSADITQPIQNILSSLGSRPAQSEKPKGSDEDAAKLIENIISSIFPGLAFHPQPQPAPSTEQAQPTVSDKGKGKARTVDVEESREPAPKPESAGEAFADILRHVMELSKSTPTPRSPDEAGPSGSSRPSPTAKPTVTEGEQAQIDRAIALSSVEHVQDTLTKLQTDFILPTELDHYGPSTEDRDDTASVSSASSSDLSKFIPYTSTNKPVYKYENELNGLLEELDRIDSHGDAEVREKRKEVAKAIEKALEGVENIVGEAVGKRISLTPTTIPVAGELLKGFDVGEDVTEEVDPASQQNDTPVVVDTIAVPEQSISIEAQEPVVAAAEASSPSDEVLPESDALAVSETTVNPSAEPTSESDLEASTVVITPASVDLISLTEPEPTQSRVQVNAPEVVEALMLPE